MKSLCITMLMVLLVASAVATTPRYSITAPASATIYTSANRYLSSGATAAQINTAINECAAAGGGTVNLRTGTYTIVEPIVMKTKVRLKGSSQSRVTIKRGNWSPTSETGMIRINGGLNNMTISDLTLDGTGYKTYLLHGIYGYDASGTNDKIRVTKVTVKNCGMGIHIKGSTNVIVENSNVSGNGGSAMYWHNIYFRRCNKVRVSYCSLNNSPTGCGVQGTDTSNFRVNNNTISGNYWRGIRSAGPSSQYIIVNNNIVQNNQQYGIGTNTENGSPQYFCFIDNTITGNQNYGVNLDGGCAHGQVQGNSCSSNSPSNYLIQGSDIQYP